MGIIEERLFVNIFRSNIHTAAKGVGRELVPKPLYAQRGTVVAAECGMSEVETHIHQSYHHSIARVGLRQLHGFVNARGIGVERH